MQSIAVYLNVDGHVATPVDEYNAVRSTPSALMRGVRTLLCLRLVDTEGEPDDAQVAGMTSWEFALAGDWDTATDPEILVTENIAVVQTTVGGKTYNEIQIPLTEMNTEELITKLGNTSKADLGAELVGFDDGETDPGFLIQFTMRVCNRRSTAGTGTPTQVSDGMYTAAQIDSLMTNYYTSIQVGDVLSGYALTDHNHDDVYAAISHSHAISDITDLQTALDARADAITVETHISDTNNPHSVTKSHLNLENVDNTSDADKPVSTAQQAAIDAAISGSSAMTEHIANTDNPHAVTKAQVQLGNVDNTADMDKPISTAVQNALDEKLPASMLTPTVAVYIDGNRTDPYTEDGSIAYPYKTIAAATAAHQEAASYFIAKGIYAETAEIDLYEDSIVYGNYSIISGSEINIGEGCFIHNMTFANTVNIAANTDSPMFHYCRFVGATMNLAGATDFEGCYVAANFNVTITAAYAIRAFNSSFYRPLSGYCQMYFNDCIFKVSSADYALTSSGGMLAMAACMVYNTSTGGGISCDNGANGTSAYNFLISVATNKDIACGTAVSIIGGDVQYSVLTGVAVVFPSRIQTALATKQDKGSSYSLGTALTGALTLDISNGGIQYGTLSGATTLAYGSISNLDEAQGFILQFDNSAGQTFSFTAEDAGSTDILTASDTGTYKLSFSKINSKICFDGKAEVVF